MSVIAVRTGLLVAALAALTWTWGFFELDFVGYGLSCVLLAAGYALAGFGTRRAGMGIAAAMYLYWTIGFAIDGFGVLSTTAAGLLAVGSVLMAWSEERFLAYGVIASLAGNLWYMIDNTFLGFFAGFAVGNWIFTVGLGFALYASLRGTRMTQGTAPVN